MIKRFVILCLLSSFAYSGEIAFDALLGSMISVEHKKTPHLDFSSHLWWKYDQMVFLGVGSGIQMQGEERIVPLLASTWLRLPFGGRTLPILTADVGYHWSDSPEFGWRVSGGLDIKNGNRSSLLVLAGYQSLQNHGAYYSLRAGLLLEF